MRGIIITYQWFVYVLLLGVLVGCASADMEEDYPESAEEVYQEGDMNAVEEASAMDAEYEKKEEAPSVKKWKSKAKQQLESIEDLLVILKDTSLDPAFKFEIEKELNLLYNKDDSVLNQLMLKDLKFKNFKALKVENGDTMSLAFKNQKEVLKAKFVVVSEAKDFGGTIEVIERLSIVSIEVEE